ncbi:hypothetical protein Golax_020455 [Gossypium laxum]|uniref:Uncharacterized protein n=1 Tax=Gossypium laxum TaxID=34288 RepID=A0A7J9B3J6_9ROSI|nr:hypothetical protein [Gossypium laxum]
MRNMLVDLWHPLEGVTISDIGEKRGPATVSKWLREEILGRDPLRGNLGGKLSARRMKHIKERCGFSNGIEVDVDGSRGGLCLGWNNGCTIQLKSYSVLHIDVEIDQGDGTDKWRCTGFYSALDERIDEL